MGRTQTTDIEELVRGILADGPEPLSGQELKALYGPSMDRARKLLHGAFARARTMDLVVQFVREAGRGAMRVLESADEVITQMFGALEPQPAYATRQLGPAPVAGRATGSGGKIVASAPGEGAVIRVSIEDAQGRCDVRVRLEDATSKAPLAPMELEVEDMESGETLLEKTEFASGEAVLRGVEPGAYWIEAECSGKSAELTLKVEGAAR